MKYYLILAVNGIKPDIIGPFETDYLRDQHALELKKEYGDNTGIFILDIDDEGNPYSGSYSGKFFEHGEE